jgi:SH3-like domain-containing protein
LFRADADAVLLTRDPEALALALAKVSAATGSSVSIATAHLYFVDPHPRTSWWFDGTFPSHPPVKARIALLARMDDGIPGRSLEDASAAGAAYLSSEARVIVAPNLRALARGAKLRLGERTLLYRSADGSSAVLADLDAHALVTVLDPGEQFVRVRVGDGSAGYVPRGGLVDAWDDEQDDGGAGIHYTLEPAIAFDERVVPGTKVRLTEDATPLYKKPDGCSDVALELASGTVVTFNELEGNFARVDADRTTGYISRTAGAASMSPPRSHS